MGGLEVLHENAGDGDDGLDEAAAGEAGDEGVVLGAEGGEEEEGDLAVVVGHVDVGEAGAVSVAEGEGGGEDVGGDDEVPFELREHLRDRDGGDCGEAQVADQAQPQWDAFSQEHFVLLFVS